MQRGRYGSFQDLYVVILRLSRFFFHVGFYMFACLTVWMNVMNVNFFWYIVRRGLILFHISSTGLTNCFAFAITLSIRISESQPAACLAIISFGRFRNKTPFYPHFRGQNLPLNSPERIGCNESVRRIRRQSRTGTQGEDPTLQKLLSVILQTCSKESSVFL